jgi:L-threonylcarbamoyladenylate synthase
VLIPNPGGHYPHLCGDDPERIGVRVSGFPPALAAALAPVGAILATSANLHGGRDPRTLAEVPAELTAGCAVLVDGGPAQAGRPSTVLDLCAPRPVILREGALATADALALIA